MRFTLSSTALSNKLSALSKVINSKNALPILGDFVFDIQGMTLTLTASDSENTMRTSIELTGSTGDGRFAIGNHDLLEAVKGFSEQPITFDANQEQNIVKISYQNGLFSLPIENADEYPMAQSVSESANTITLPNAILAENINRSIFATAQDELRPVMIVPSSSCIATTTTLVYLGFRFRFISAYPLSYLRMKPTWTIFFPISSSFAMISSQSFAFWESGFSQKHHFFSASTFIT